MQVKRQSHRLVTKKRSHSTLQLTLVTPDDLGKPAHARGRASAPSTDPNDVVGSVGQEAPNRVGAIAARGDAVMEDTSIDSLAGGSLWHGRTLCDTSASYHRTPQTCPGTPWHVQSRKVNLLLIPRFRVRLPARAPVALSTSSFDCLSPLGRGSRKRDRPAGNPRGRVDP